MRAINEIIIHCSATPEHRDIRAATIDKWHRNKGWNCIGYHYVIDLDGTIETGRSLSAEGAHTVGHNKNSIGICYIGGCDITGKKAKDTRTFEQSDSLYRLCCELLSKFPDAKLSGHNQWAKKACPSFDVPTWARMMGLPYDDTIKRV